ncbi:MAG: RNase adapter RapZ [Gaiellales bacterium]|nr:MAG: RNase adapter RapZ [Gaiellales bacterium]
MGDIKRPIEFTIISGMSGAGKSHALAAFEDAGYFSIDNLPPQMIAAASDLFALEGSKVEKAALVTDVRGGKYFEEIDRCLNELDSKQVPYRLLFLEASDQTLLRRFKETRRPHPLAPEGDIPTGIKREREMLEGLKERAEWVINTSNLNIHELRQSVIREAMPGGSHELIITVISFGYKYGTPLDADLLFDVRFLPNPNYEPKLKPLTGLDRMVSNYVLETSDGAEFREKVGDLLDYLLPRYLAEGKTNLTIGVGCTGGHHRSVAIAEWLAGRYRSDEFRYNVIVRHRDIDKAAT